MATESNNKAAPNTQTPAKTKRKTRKKSRVSTQKRRKMLEVWLKSKSVREVMRACSTAHETVMKYKRIDKWEDVEAESYQSLVRKLEDGALKPLDIKNESDLISELYLTASKYFLHARTKQILEFDINAVDKLVRLISFIKAGGEAGKPDRVGQMTDAELNVELIQAMKEQGVESFTKETTIKVESKAVEAECEVVEDNPADQDKPEDDQNIQNREKDDPATGTDDPTPDPPEHLPPHDIILLTPARGPQPPLGISPNRRYSQCSGGQS